MQISVYQAMETIKHHASENFEHQAVPLCTYQSCAGACTAMAYQLCMLLVLLCLESILMGQLYPALMLAPVR